MLRFDWVEPFGVKNVELNRSALQFLPIDVRRVAEKGDARALTRKLEDWLMKRVAPMSRAFVRQLLEGLGFDSRDPRHLRKVIEFCRGLSLNDVHWIVEDSFDGCWADFNLYDNPFPESVAGLAFAGQGRVDVNHASTSPEMTTNGNLAKCWRRETKGIFLYKAGHAMTGTERFPGGLTDSMRARLDGLSGFAYRRDKYYNLPADVFARVQKFQQKRISEILHFGAKADEFLTKDLLSRTETPTDLEAAVLEKLTENPRTSRKELATALAVGTTTVSKILKSLSLSGRIRRIGSARGGYWKMIR